MSLAATIISDWPLYSFISTFIHQTLFYATDLAGTSNFLLLAVFGLLAGGSYFRRQVILTSLVSVWATRLGSFLFLRVLLRRRDGRFGKIRDSSLRLSIPWILQTLWVWITSLPVTFTNTVIMTDPPITMIDKIGWGLWMVGFLIESIADVQKHNFNMTKTERGRPFIDTGLWKYTRHPNYFGEILLWTGIWISAANGLYPNFPLKALLAFASPLTTFILLVYVSGIPLAEARDDRQNHQLMAYKQYKFRTSPLIPVPPSWYASIPPETKRWLFFDRYQLAFITPNIAGRVGSRRSSHIRRD